MKKLTFALGAAAFLSLVALTAPAQAEIAGGHFVQAQHYYVQPAPPPRYYRDHDRRYYAPPPRYYRDADRGYGRGWEGRRYSGRRDYDGDGVPNRYDRRPNNPYRY